MNTTRSTPDMWELASALYLHGPNEATLHAVLPAWSKSDLRQVLRRFKGKAERERALLQGRSAPSSTAGPHRKKFKTEVGDSKGLNFSLSGEPAKTAATTADNDDGNEGVDTNEGATTLANTSVFSNNARLNLTYPLSNNNTTTGVGGGASTSSSTAGARGRSGSMAAGGGLLSWSELVRKVHAVQGTTDRNKSSKHTPIRDHSQLLSKVMLYSACFEDHYHGGRPDDTCYSEIYRYLSQLLAGEEPTQLRARSAAKVLQLLDGLRAVLETGALSDRQRALRELRLEELAGEQQGAGAASTTTLKMEDSKSRAPLFADPDEASGQFDDLEESGSSLGEACAALDPRHPYFQERREALNSRLMALQECTAASLTLLPGLNPLSIPPALLIKPLAAFPPSYPARIQEGQAPT